MNTVILKKCVEELNKETPRLDYVRGMLETLIEIQETKTVIPEKKLTAADFAVAVPASDEAAMLDAKARAALAIIKETQTTV